MARRGCGVIRSEPVDESYESNPTSSSYDSERFWLKSQQFAASSICGSAWLSGIV